MLNHVPSIVAGSAIAFCLTVTPHAHAAPIVYYDFEGETGSTITDKAGPGLSNATRDDSATSLVSFNGSTGLQLETLTDDAAIDFGQGVNGELAGDFADGLIVDAVFQMGEGWATGNPTIAARNRLSDDRSWQLGIFGTHATLGGRLFFTVSGDGSTTDSVYSAATSLNGETNDLVVQEGVIYAVRAIFDPGKDSSQRLSITLTRLDNGAEATTTDSTSLAALYTSPNVSTIIGAQMASSGAYTGEFLGTVDDVRISTVPEPASLMLCALGAGLLVGQRRRHP